MSAIKEGCVYVCRIFPIFKKVKCNRCSKKFKWEKGWVGGLLFIKKNAVIKDFHLCSECSPSKTSAIGYFTRLYDRLKK